MLVEVLITKRIQAWRACKPRTKNPKLQLDAFLNFHCSDRDGWCVILQVLRTELRYLGASSRDSLKTHYIAYAEELCSIIEQGCTDGDFNVPHPPTAAHAILAMLEVLMGLGISSLDLFDKSTMPNIKYLVNKILVR